MPNIPKTHTGEPPDRKWNGTDALLIAIVSSGWVNRLQPQRERSREWANARMSDCFLDPQVWRRCMLRCPLQHGAKERTAERETSLTACETKLSNSVSAPRLIIGEEQRRARTKQVPCNQQLAGACDEPQRQSKLSLHGHTHTHAKTRGRTRTRTSVPA